MGLGTDAASGDATGPTFDPQQVDNPEEVDGYLKAHQQRVSELLETLTINEIEEFAALVSESAGKLDYPPLAEWAESLTESASMFDTDSMAKHLGEFGSLTRISEDEE